MSGIVYGTEHSETDYTTPVGKVRLLISDVSTDLSIRLFSNAQLNAFLEMSGGSIKRTAAVALRTIATSEVLLSKKIRTQDLSTDGPAVAAQLRALAAVLASEADAEEGDGDSIFDVVGFGYQAKPEGAEWRL